MKPAIRHGPDFQAVIPPLSELKPKTAKEPSAKKGGRGGSLISADAVLISVIGPEKAASDALPMDAKMDPNEGIGETPSQNTLVNASPVHQKLTVSQECGSFPKAECETFTCGQADSAAARPEAKTEAAVARTRMPAVSCPTEDSEIYQAISADVAGQSAFSFLGLPAGKQVLLQRGQRQRKKPQWLNGTIDPHVPDKKWGLPTNPQVSSIFSQMTLACLNPARRSLCYGSACFHILGQSWKGTSLAGRYHRLALLHRMWGCPQFLR